VNGPRAASLPELTKTALAETGDFVVERVDCRCATTGWSPLEPAVRYGIVFVSRGCFRRQ
jgi:hypothetical protein